MKHLTLFLFCLAVTSCGLGPAKFEPKLAPIASNVAPEANEVKVVVEVLSDGSAIFQGKKFQMPENLEKLREAVASQRGPTERYVVGVRAAHDVKPMRVLPIIDELKKIDGVIIGVQYDGLQ